MRRIRWSADGDHFYYVCLLQKPIPQMSGGDRRSDHLRHRSERTSPERSLQDHEAPPRPAKRKADQHHDLERDYDYDDRDNGRDRERDRHHHHHDRSESSKHSLEPATKATGGITPPNGISNGLSP